MCGIAGAVNWGNSKTLARMTDIQAHRGPDDSSLWEHHFPDGTYVSLGNRCLAILDLSPCRPYAHAQRGDREAAQRSYPRG